MDFWSYFLLLNAAFFASLSHCIGMCGGIVVGLNMRHFDGSWILQAFANLLYFLGRMCGYIIIGLCFVFIGKSFGFNETAKAVVFILLGILLFITAFIITFSPKILNTIAPKGNYAWYKKAFHSAMQKKSISGFFIIGILNGFLPCHLVYMFAIKAADSLSVFHSVLCMIVFSLGTFLPLFLVGFFSQKLLSSTLRRFFLYIAFIVMGYFAINSIYKGVQLLQNHDKMHHHDMGMHGKMPPESRVSESSSGLKDFGYVDSKSSDSKLDSKSKDSEDSKDSHRDFTQDFASGLENDSFRKDFVSKDSNKPHKTESSYEMPHAHNH